MKKKLYIWGSLLLSLVIISFVYYYIDILTFTPLKDKEFKKLFVSYKEIKKKHSADYIGLSIHSELFEIYLFNTQKVLLDINYPNYANEWEKEIITNETIISKWRNCPLDATDYKRFEFALTSNDYNQNRYLEAFNTELCDPQNFYSYVYFNDLEHYFLLYCPRKEKLYYIRMKL